jgi:hypothetical protein
VIAESHVQGGAPRVAAGRNRSNPYDLSGDGNVDAVDVTELEQALPSVPGDANWNELADLNADGAVDSSDRRILLDNMDEGSSVGTPTPTRPPEPAEGGTLFLPFGTTLRRA